MRENKLQMVQLSSASALKKFFLILFLGVLGLHCCSGFSLVVVSGGYYGVLVRRLLIVVTSL